MVPYERSSHKEYTCVIWKTYRFWFESYDQGKVFVHAANVEANMDTNVRDTTYLPVHSSQLPKNYGTFWKVLLQKNTSTYL